jgi:hypothetical protein
MAPTIIPYPIEGIANSTATNKFVALMQLVSDPDPSVFSYYDFMVGFLIVFSLWLIIFLSLKMRGHSFIASFSAANVSNFVLVLLMYPLGIISGQVFVFSMILVPISAFCIWAFGS